MLIEDIKKGREGIVIGEIEDVGQDFLILSDATGKIKIRVKNPIKLPKGTKIMIVIKKENDEYVGSYPKKVNINLYHYEKYVNLLKKFKEYIDNL